MSILALLLLSSWNDANPGFFTVRGTVLAASDSSPLPGVTVLVKGTEKGTVTNLQGRFELNVPSGESVLVFSFVGFITKEVPVEKKRQFEVRLQEDLQSLSEVVVSGYERKTKRMKVHATMDVSESFSFAAAPAYGDYTTPFNTEEYATIHENIFFETLKNPLSTFSIDVDNASYSNIRRFINLGQQPPKDAVRIEEMINYFTYDYAQPAGEDPFSVHTEISECPWNSDHRLVHIGLQGREIPTGHLPASNLVFLIDVSGSMSSPQKLPLVKTGFKLLVDKLRPQDRVAIVVYAGAAGVVLPPTAGDRKTEIMAAIERLQSGGSTAGGAGIIKAYELAEKNFIKGGNNRVILATDGDFNIGVSSNAAMERLIEEKRESGVFLTVLGFGTGNYKDAKMEILANKGNGNYAYIDNIMEAKKVFVNEFGGTLFTIAKDVKLQLEFNPARVKGYRLIGYENRMLKKEEFHDDKKDAGELGSGHSVTALYEIIPAGIQDSPYLARVDTLKYQQNPQINPAAYTTDELFTLKLRYKKPDGDTSKLIEKACFDKQLPLTRTSDNFRFSAAVASFGMLLRDSEFKGTASLEDVLELAKGAQGKDEEGYRAEFIRMIRSSQLVAKK